MIGAALWLGLSAAWASDAWLLGMPMSVVTLPYWGVPVVVCGYLVAMCVLDRREGRR